MAGGMLNSMLSVFGLNKKNIKDNNELFTDFDRLNNENEQDRESVLNKFFNDQQGGGVNYDSSSSFVNFVYGSVSTNKPIRLGNYRQMASFPEVSDAIDEICDAFINRDENGHCINLNLNAKFEGLPSQEIEDAWDEYIQLFDLENNGFEYMRKLAIDGECCWENIIDKDHKDMGIIGVNYLKPESFEYAIDMTKSKKVGITVFTNKSDVDLDAHMNTASSKDNQTVMGGIKVTDLNFSEKIREGSAVMLPWEQITYVDSGIYSSDGLVSFPILERARKAYNQLSLIEDSIIIYRLVRAPERLVFNVDTGNLPRHRAEQETMKLMKRYQTKKVYNPVTGSVTNDYDPHQMIESYWFTKPAGTQGTSVDTLQTNANLGELEDLHYFLRKLYLSLKVPFNRYQEPTVQIERSETISYEEYRFAKFIIRLQNCFTKGFTNGFKTHLKLKGLWKNHNIRDNDFKISFAPPTSFEVYEQQKLLESRINNYDNIASRDEFSTTLAQKKYLGMKEEEIQANNNQLEKDRFREAMIKYREANIEDHGSPNPEGEEEEGGGFGGGSEESSGEFGAGAEEENSGEGNEGGSLPSGPGFGEA